MLVTSGLIQDFYSDVYTTHHVAQRQFHDPREEAEVIHMGF